MKIEDIVKEILASNSRLLTALWHADKEILDKKFSTTACGPFHYDSAATHLCRYLAIYTNCDRDMIDKLFRKSALYNDRWDNDPVHRYRMINRGILKSQQK